MRILFRKLSKSVVVGYTVVLLAVSYAAAADGGALQYILKPRTERIAVGEMYWVDYFVVNKTNADVTLCKCNVTGQTIVAELKAGVESGFVDKWHTVGPPTGGDFINIRPGATVKFGAAGFGEEYFRYAGTWMLQIRETFKRTRSPSGIDSWEGTIESNVLRVLVDEPT